MENKRIAKELVQIARSLVAKGVKGVADQPVAYKRFTGRIKWNGTSGIVRNADFELTDDGVMWDDGTWERGTWYSGVWKRGTWKGGTWTSGTWKDGTWENGVWEDGVWERGTWRKGTWEFGSNKAGRTYGRDYSPNMW